MRSDANLGEGSKKITPHTRTGASGVFNWPQFFPGVPSPGFNIDYSFPTCVCVCVSRKWGPLQVVSFWFPSKTIQKGGSTPSLGGTRKKENAINPAKPDLPSASLQLPTETSGFSRTRPSGSAWSAPGAPPSRSACSAQRRRQKTSACARGEMGVLLFLRTRA